MVPALLPPMKMYSNARYWGVLLLLGATMMSSNRGGGLVVAFSANRRPTTGYYRRTISTTTAMMTAVLQEDEASTTTSMAMTLPELFPNLATSLNALGFSTPTPIQLASATALTSKTNSQNLLLVAPTGSGKTLAYLLPALSKALDSTASGGTVLVVAPTRELAVQLQRDTVSLLATSDEQKNRVSSAVLLAVNGVPPPTTLTGATVLVGTPTELFHVLKNNGKEFMPLRAVILDEVDVLLPIATKTFRTSLDKNSNNRDPKKGGPGERERRRQQEERQKLAHARKLKAAKQAGTQLDNENNSQVVAPTDQLLRLIAAKLGDQDRPQIIAASATASRRTLDRLNRALRTANSAAASGDVEREHQVVTMCRPPNDDAEAAEGGEADGETAAAQHTIRSVTVPSQVNHNYISLSKESAMSSDAVLTAVAKAAAILKPQTALVFLCGEFAKSNVNQKKQEPAPKSRKKVFNNKQATAKAAPKIVSSSDPTLLSARKTCEILGKFGIEAQPLHVAIGLEKNVNNDDDADKDAPPFLVTFEGSARGLHFDAVDTVFIVGRPASAASYLHLAGRVGRSSTSTNGDGSVVIRPGTVVSMCTKGSATELEKWTRQIGGTTLEELVLLQ